jgi:hypothetical protein
MFMTTPRQFSGPEKMQIRRLHLLKHKRSSEVCQQELVERGTAAFERASGARHNRRFARPARRGRAVPADKSPVACKSRRTSQGLLGAVHRRFFRTSFSRRSSTSSRWATLSSSARGPSDLGVAGASVE